MKKKHAAISIALCIVILCSSLTASADDNRQVVLTLEDAQKRALEVSLEYNWQNDNINDAIDEYNDTEESADEQRSEISKGFYDYFMKPINIDDSVQSATDNVKTEKFKKEDMKRKSDYNVLEAFINIKKAQYALEDAKLQSGIKSKEHEAAKLKYNLELIKKDELRQAETAYDSAVDAAESAHRSLQEEFQTLNRYIGRELTDYNLQIVLDLENIDITIIDLDKLREDYIANREDLFSLELKADKARKKYDATKERYDEFAVRLKVENSREQMEEAFDDATREYDTAREAFEDATIELDMSLNTSYENLKTASDSIAKLQEEIQLAESDAKLAGIRYDMEQISRIEMEKALMEVETLKNKLKSEIADLNLKYEGLMMYSEELEE
ncbi:MAG TPA: hypothetical protein VEG39_17535 [Clostridia bacterium]|nr:hypothetical protein [Clostridia bacterium]